MDISKLVNNEQLFTLNVTAPGSTKPIGITIKLRSAGSDEAMKVVRKQTNDGIERAQRKVKPDAEYLEQTELEQAASYVASWEWADPMDWKGVKPDCTPEMVAEVFREAPWIYAQVVAAARDVANFTKG